MEDFERLSVASAAADDVLPHGVTLSGSRTSERSTLILVAQLRLDSEQDSHEVRVRNLSEGGLMLELDRPVDGGTPVWLLLDGIGEITGKVAWCTQGRVGVALDAMIDPDMVRERGR